MFTGVTEKSEGYLGAWGGSSYVYPTLGCLSHIVYTHSFWHPSPDHDRALVTVI
ncbi:hypothetical protein BDZ94DRAFT_1248390 [Collybia nuda]|uniref:Uncharacterized protein n=1 Tax=Collybia nuda TaxID=64659 RepID=A0A9P6CP18_9AGAR|nr:hypothetical protein BDZ94DRAFT_1248390 [Collybia nuda]